MYTQTSSSASSTRPATLALLALVAACDQGPSERQVAADVAQEQQVRTRDPANRIACAVDGAAAFEDACATERVDDVLVVRQPDGGFHRLRLADGTVTAADGAEPARTVQHDGGETEVAIGDARYRLPAALLR